MSVSFCMRPCLTMADPHCVKWTCSNIHYPDGYFRASGCPCLQCDGCPTRQKFSANDDILLNIHGVGNYMFLYRQVKIIMNSPFLEYFFSVNLTYSFTLTSSLRQIDLNHNNHQTHDCLLNRLFRHRSKKSSKLRVTSLCGWIPHT